MEKKLLYLLLNIVKNELIKEYDNFFVKVIQILYDDNYIEYCKIKEEDITNIVTI